MGAGNARQDQPAVKTGKRWATRMLNRPLQRFNDQHSRTWHADDKVPRLRFGFVFEWRDCIRQRPFTTLTPDP
jgi:hypothetical protein